MYLVTSNEKNSLTSSERQQDVAAIFDALSTEPIVLWQEIKTAENHNDVIVKLPVNYTHVFGPTIDDANGLPIPISVPPRYEVQDQRFLRTKENTGATFDVGSAERYYGVVQLRDTTRSLPSFHVINTHLTNGCDWDLPYADCDDQAKFLRPYWNAHWDKLNLEISRIKKSLDSTVFYGGDFNRKNSPPFGMAEKLAVGDGKIDKLAVIDRSVDTRLMSTTVIKTLSDHDAHSAKWNLSKRL